ncbi:MAG: Trk system potassium transporter TrkA [Ruminococcus sp.]|nr:Trk system potassium transporter TrkA [Ruminococcus sp.]
MNIIVVGAGKIGKYLTKTLRDEGHDVVVVDIDEQRVDKVVEAHDVNGICGNGTQCDVLEEAGVDDAYLVIATTASDEINLLSCLIATKMGAKHAIARVRNPQYVRQIDFMKNEMNISVMVNPDMSIATEIARILKFPTATNYETFANGRVDMIEVSIKSENNIIDKPIYEISQIYGNNFLICAVRRGEEVFIPNGNFVIREKDKIYIAGPHKTIVNIFKGMGILKNRIKNVMIIGGSRIAYYLTMQLNKMGMDVTIVEKNPERCRFLSNELPEAKIVLGNAADHKLLIEEGIASSDAVVTVTDSDESNFLVAMYADTFKVKKLVTKINEPEFYQLYDKIMGESAISLSQVTSSIVVRYLRGRLNTNSNEMKSLYKLMGGSVEAIEFEAQSGCDYIGKPIKTLKFKKNLLIASIIRKRKVIFPTGDDMIQSGDMVVIVTKEISIRSLRDIFV